MNTVVEVLRPRVRRARAWAHRHNGRLLADLERRYNLNQLQRFEAALNRHGRSFRTSSAILEFGCGEGRLLQHLFEYAPKVRVFGCDVRPGAIETCRRRFSAGRFAVNGTAPPLRFDGERFDLIYSYSVFTHLSEPNHLAWLGELAGWLAPGGMMLHTVHSCAYLRRAAMFSPASLEKYRFPAPVEAMLQAGPAYYYIADHPATPEYGHAIIREEYVRVHWPQASGLQLLEYAEGAIEAYPEGCQDLVLLRKAG